MRRSNRRFGFFAGCICLVTGLAGCGGGGSGGPGVPNGVCNENTFAPNYATSLNNLQRWSGFPLRIYLGPADAGTIELTLRGFDQWVDATGGRVSYVRVNNPDNADVTVQFDINSGQDELGIATTRFQGRTLIDASIVFYYLPANAPGAARINQAVAAHEFGHVLGIGIHSPFPSDLMYSETDGRNNTVTARDLNTLLTAYCDTFPQRVVGSKRTVPQSDEPVQTRTMPVHRDSLRCTH